MTLLAFNMDPLELTGLVVLLLLLIYGIVKFYRKKKGKSL